MGSTKIINDTTNDLTLKIGNHLHFFTLTTIKKHGNYTVEVDSNSTYQEYLLASSEGSEGKKLIISTDDCCDNKCFTIKEEDGYFTILKEPRKQWNSEQPVVDESLAKMAPLSLKSIWTWLKVFVFGSAK